MAKIKELPNIERPYEKLQMYGEKYLSNAELLAIIIKTGTKKDSAVSLAQKILSLKKEQNLASLQDISVEELKKIKGIGKVKSIQIKAVCELAKRMTKPFNLESIIIRTSKDAADLLMNELQQEKKEVIKVILLNNKNKIQKIVEILSGGITSVNLSTKDIFQDAIKIGIPKIIIVHNHPSGDPTPSQADYDFTEKVMKAAEILQVQLLDHIVIGNGKYESIMLNQKKNKNSRQGL